MPADLVVLSFSDSDLATFAAGWRRGRGGLPSLRLANLVELRHPLSVDTYIERTLPHARGILVRLIGGEPYWAYGLSALHRLAKDRGIALAALPADGRDDPRLDELSTLPASTLRRLKRLCDQGGAIAAQAAIAAARAGRRPLGRAGYRRDRYSRDGIVRSRPWRHGRAAWLDPQPPRAGDVLSLLSHRRRYRTGRCVDRRVQRARVSMPTAPFVTSLKAPGVADWLRDASRIATPGRHRQRYRLLRTRR